MEIWEFCTWFEQSSLIRTWIQVKLTLCAPIRTWSQVFRTSNLAICSLVWERLQNFSFLDHDFEPFELESNHSNLTLNDLNLTFEWFKVVFEPFKLDSLTRLCLCRSSDCSFGSLSFLLILINFPHFPFNLPNILPLNLHHSHPTFQLIQISLAANYFATSVPLLSSEIQFKLQNIRQKDSNYVDDSEKFP
jgi:hypothetical protein